jgi:formylglycine-generating enzyme required for sulfatase activity
MLWLMAACPCLSQTAKTLGVRASSGSYAGTTFYTNSHAIIIGIHEYKYLPEDKWLPFCDKDAIDLRDILVRSYGFAPENVTLLINERATRRNIEVALSTLSERSIVGENDRNLIFFSGHGQTVTLPGGGVKGFLIPYDAEVDLAHLNDAGPYNASCLSMATIWQNLESTPARHTLLIADACFAGAFISKTLGGEHPNATVVAQDLQRRGIQALTAGTSDEESLIFPDLGHSILTAKLLEELRAQAATPDNVFFASQLAAGLKTSVANVVASRTSGRKSQTPQFGAYSGMDGDFIFLSTAPAPVPRLSPQLMANGSDSDSGTGQNPAIHRYPASRGSLRVNRVDGSELVYIPAGRFLMGDDDDAIRDDRVSMQNNPRHIVRLSAYYIYKNLVTVGQYKWFCQNTGRPMPSDPIFNGNDINPGWAKEDHPMVNVSWDDAVAYCTWAGGALPTEAQWERAARGTNGQLYPWGDQFDASKLWCSRANLGDAGGTAVVGQYGVSSATGCTDMAGNVWQWCRDNYDPRVSASPGVEVVNPLNVAANQTHVLRGGGWPNLNPLYFRSAFRERDQSGGRFDFGFRCVLPAGGS